MSDPLRSLLSSSSPGRVSRPHWPWSTYSHHSSQSSLHSRGSTPVPGSQTALDHRSSISSNGPPSTLLNGLSWRHNPATMALHSTTRQEENPRHWSFTAFEWVVRDVQKLKYFVEGKPAAADSNNETENTQTLELDDFEVLKESPMLGEGKFKLEIARVVRMPLGESEPNKIHGLSLFITSESLMVDFAHGFEMSASMMAAIKCQDDRVGVRGARSEWIWEFWQNDWVFRQESEVWECPLPSLSTLLENPRVRETDSFVICVQIHCPLGPFFPQQPSAYYVPRELLEGLEASLDNPNTGDVRFVCLERLSSERQPSPSGSPSASEIPITRCSSTSSTSSPFSMQTTARKRIIYAHSDILSRRSEYFATMLGSAFSENASGLITEERKKLYTVVVEEADFGTIYWLLKWVYANWLMFREQDDPRAAVDGVGAGWSARWLNLGRSEWDWKTFRKGSASEDSSAGDARSAKSAESLRPTAEAIGASSSKAKPFQTGSTLTSPPTRSSSSSRTPTSSSSKVGTSASASSRQLSSTARRAVASPSTSSTPPTLALNIGNATSPTINQTKPVPITLAHSTTNYASPHYPISPRSQRQFPHAASVISTPDPHPHPTPAPGPASALSMYQVAHRYAMPGLAALALEHMMSTITPSSSFALLLATSVWDELHLIVEDYVVEKWEEVSVSDEFELCCQEVAAGEWGAEGGKTLMALFRRLRSPMR